MKQEIKITRSKHKLRPNFVYKDKKYSACIVAIGNDLTLEISYKDKHGNCFGVTLFNLNKSIKNFLDTITNP
jgi:hypothetical protein